MAREPVRRADPPESPKPAEPAKAAETPTKTAAEAKAERRKVSLHLGKPSAPSVYATPYGSEPANIDPQTGRAIAPKPAA
jgi:hypothetical protein